MGAGFIHPHTFTLSRHQVWDPDRSEQQRQRRHSELQDLEAQLGGGEGNRRSAERVRAGDRAAKALGKAAAAAGGGGDEGPSERQGASMVREVPASRARVSPGKNRI